MKLVFRAGDYSEFLVTKSQLEQAGFHVFSDNAQSYSTIPELGLTDGYRLWIADDEYDKAIKLLSE